MALTWDIRNVTGCDYEAKYGQSPYDKEWHPVTQVVVWRMMHCGIGPVLTEKNAKELFVRAKIADSLTTPLLMDADKARSLTAQEINDHIGLHVNVSQETRSQFLKRYLKYDLERWERHYDWQLSNPDQDPKEY